MIISLQRNIRHDRARKIAKSLLLSMGVFLAACVTQQTRIESERKEYLADPTMPSYQYDGKLSKGGSHYLYLYERDPAFGEFLLQATPKAKDPRIVVAALTYFTSKQPDLVKFEQVVAVIDPKLMDQEVDLSGSDVIIQVSLRRWIEDTRKLIQK